MTKMKLCPIEPTDEMIVKGIAAIVTCDSVSLAYEAMTAECQTVEVVCKDDAEQAIWQAIRDICSGNKTDDKLILRNLSKNGYKLVRFCDEQ